MRLKLIVGIICGVIIVVLVGLYIVLSSYNFNDLKPRISQAVEDATGRKLTLGGDIRLKIGLTPSLVLEDVSFQNAAWGSRPEMAKIKRLEIQVRLLPLLSKKISVKRFVLVDPDILIEISQTGKSNLSFEGTINAENPQNQKAVESTSNLPAVFFKEVRIEKGLVTFIDHRSGKSSIVKLDNLALSASDEESPIQLECKGAYDDKQFGVSGTLGSLADLMTQGKTWPVKLSVKAAGATAKIEGDIKDALRARTFAFNVEAQGPSISNVVRLADVKSVPEVGPFKATVRVVGQENSLSIEKIEADLGSEDLARLKLSGSVKDLLKQRGIDISFDATGKDLATLTQLAGKERPFNGPFQVSGRIRDLAAKTYEISALNAKVGENDLEGTIELGLDGSRPKVTGALSSHKMDLRPLMQKENAKGEKGGAGEKAVARSDKVFSSEPLPFDLLKKADANLRIQAGRILTPKLAVDQLDATVLLEDGALTLKPVKANVGGGALDLKVDVRPKGKSEGVDLVLRVKNLDLGRMTKDLGITKKLEGKVDLNVDAAGAGTSVAQIMGDLNGKTMLIMGEGQIDHDYINMLGADLSRTLLRLINPLSHEAKQTKINCFVSGFDIHNGLARSTALVFDTDYLSVIGEGTINLRTEQLSISLNPSPKEGMGVSGLGKVSFSLSELAKPFKLGGTLAKPSLTVDLEQAALSIGKAAGGAALFGPLGIAAALGSSSSGGENRCVAAIAAAKKGVRVEKRGTIEKATEGIKGTAESIGGGLKKFFGK